MPAAATQPEIVLWKSIENSTRPDDFRGYLKQLSKRRLRVNCTDLRLATGDGGFYQREASDFKTFTLPVEHEQSGMIYPLVLWAHPINSKRAPPMMETEDRIGFSKVDVITGRGCGTRQVSSSG